MSLCVSLDWPDDLFGHEVQFDDPPADRVRINQADYCACGCGRRHLNRISWTKDEQGPDGQYRHVLWYCSNEHKATHIRKEIAHA